MAMLDMSLGRPLVCGGELCSSSSQAQPSFWLADALLQHKATRRRACDHVGQFACMCPSKGHCLTVQGKKLEVFTRNWQTNTGRWPSCEALAFSTADAAAVVEVEVSSQEATSLWMVDVPSATERSLPAEGDATTGGESCSSQGEASRPSLPRSKTRRRKSRKAARKDIFAPPLELLAETRRRAELDKRLPEMGLGLGGSNWSVQGGGLQWLEESRKENQAFVPRRRRPQQAGGLVKRITELTKKKQLNQIFKEVEEAQAVGVPPVNVIVMNAVMNACVSLGEVDRALEIFDELCQPGGLGVTEVTYGILLKGLGKAGRLDEAFALLESMEAGTAPGSPAVTEVHLHTLLNACAEAGDAMRARGVLLRGGPPLTFSYNMLLKAYALSENPLGALRVVDEMRARGVALQRASYNALILACVRGSRADKALQLLDEMKSRSRLLRTNHLLPDVITYTSLLAGVSELARAFLLQHQGEQSHRNFNAFEEDKEPNPAGPRPTPPGAPSTSGVAVVDAVLSSAAWLGLGQGSWVDDVGVVEPREGWAGEVAARKVRAVVSEMRSAPGCIMDRVGFAAAVDACLAVGAIRDAEELFSEMEQLGLRDKGLKPRPHTVLALMRYYAKEGHFPRCNLLSELLVSPRIGGRPTPEQRQEADELCLEALVNGGELGAARERLRGMKEGRPLGSRALQALVRLYAAGEEGSLAAMQPVMLRPEVSPRAYVSSLLIPVEQMRPVSGEVTVGEVLSRFQEEPVLLVAGEDGRCLGAVCALDCTQVEVPLREVMRPLPEPIAGDASVALAAARLLQEQAELLPVVEAEPHRQSRSRERDGHTSSGVYGRAKRIAGFITRAQVFDTNDELLNEAEE